MIGIYKIENKINGQVYIGQSRDIAKRWNRHHRTAFNEKDHNYDSPLYRAIRKYGWEQFDFQVIEECSIAQLNEREKYWIKYYNSYFNGYNLTLGGDGSGTEVKKQAIIGIFNDLQNTNLKHHEIAEKYGMSTEMVQGINTGRYWKRDDIEYPIQKQQRAVQHYCCDCGKPIFRTSIRCISCESKHRAVPLSEMPVTKEELKTLIRTVPFVKIGEMYGVSDNAIRKWCAKLGLPKSSRQIKQYSDKEWDKV